MKQTKWKKWHKIFLSIVGFFIILFIIIVSISKPLPGIPLTKFQQDSIRIQQDSINRRLNSDRAFAEGKLNLIVYVQQQMNDPESFELVNAGYWNDDSDKIVIKMTYRGKNAFGGKVTEIVRATAKMNGELIEVNKE